MKKVAKTEHDMKTALQLCSLAVTSNSAVSGMVRVADGFIQAFGGIFTISVPTTINIGCCFNPVAIAPFFRKERSAIAYTIKNEKLILTEGKERLTVRCLPPEELAIIDNLGKQFPSRSI